MKNKKLPLPQLVIFDMDGLLFDTERLFQQKKAAVMQKYGYQQGEGDYEKTLGTCGQALLDILAELYGPDYPAEKISSETREIVNRQIMSDGPPIKPGIRKLLIWLKERNIPCCVASSTRTDIVCNYVKRGALEPYFSYVIGGDQVSASKPDPEIFLKACERMNILPEHALVLEDSQNGVLAAINGGIPAICIPDMAVPKAYVLEKAAAVVSSADDVPELFERAHS